MTSIIADVCLLVSAALLSAGAAFGLAGIVVMAVSKVF